MSAVAPNEPATVWGGLVSLGEISGRVVAVGAGWTECAQIDSEHPGTPGLRG